jgi:phosphoserine phosphatase
VLFLGGYMIHEREPKPTITGVIFDLDSTLTTIEGIDELARCNGVQNQIIPLTHQAMNGDIAFEDIFFKRLDIISPTYDQMVWLGHYYIQHLTPGALELMHYMKKKHLKTFVVSGGYNPAVGILTKYLQIPDDHVFTNELVFDTDGNYRHVDTTIPLWKHSGKIDMFHHIKKCYQGNYIVVGDGMSDYEMGSHADQFLCFTGVVERPQVVQKSKTILHNLFDVTHYL